LVFKKPYSIISILDKFVEETKKWHPNCFIRKVEPNMEFLAMRKDFLLEEDKKSSGKLLDPAFKL